jgi:peroxiredoxin
MRKTRKLDRQVTAPSPPLSRRPLEWKLVVIPLVVVAVLLGGGLVVRTTLIQSTAPTMRSGSNNPPAPDFSMATVNGPTFSLAAQRGRPVVLYFMAAWCTSCLAESNALGQIQQKYGDRVRIMLVDMNGNVDSPGAVRTFVERSQGPSRYWVIDADGTITRAYSVTSLDTTYVIDKRGRIAYRGTTSLDASTLDHILRQVA